MTLFDLLVQTYDKLGQLSHAKATGGSVSTVVDSLLMDESEDDAFNGAPVFLTYDAGGAGAAPEGEFSECTAFDSSLGTLSVSPVFSAAVAAGDIYALAPALFPLYSMIQFVNDALKDLGDIPLVDTSLTSAAGQREYSIPVAVKRQRPFRIEIPRSSTSGDSDFEPIYDYSWAPAAPGSSGLLVFNHYLRAGYTIKIWYRGVHPTVRDATDPIAEVLDPTLVALSTAHAAVQWYNRFIGGTDEFWLQSEDKIARDLDNRKAEVGTNAPPQDPQLFIFGSGNTGYSRFTGDELA
jgi:hypothetical protein